MKGMKVQEEDRVIQKNYQHLQEMQDRKWILFWEEQ
jgi:hypothetical protein